MSEDEETLSSGVADSDVEECESGDDDDVIETTLVDNPPPSSVAGGDEEEDDGGIGDDDEELPAFPTSPLSSSSSRRSLKRPLPPSSSSSSSARNPELILSDKLLADLEEEKKVLKLQLKNTEDPKPEFNNLKTVFNRTSRFKGMYAVARYLVNGTVSKTKNEQKRVTMLEKIKAEVEKLSEESREAIVKDYHAASVKYKDCLEVVREKKKKWKIKNEELNALNLKHKNNQRAYTAMKNKLASSKPLTAADASYALGKELQVFSAKAEYVPHLFRLAYELKETVRDHMDNNNRKVNDCFANFLEKVMDTQPGKGK